MILCLLAAALAAETPEPPEAPADAAAPAVVAPPAVDAETAAAFGDHLLAEGDAYNALTWYRLSLFLAPDAPEAERRRFRVGLAYESGERWEAAAFAYGEVKGALGDRAAYRAAICELRGGHTSAGRAGLEGLGTWYPESEWAPRGAFAAGVLALEQRDLKAAQASFAAFPWPEDPLAARAASLGSAAAAPLPRRSPALAATLSVVPGLGQLYAGHPGDAVMAALFNLPLAVGAGVLIADGVEGQRGLEIGAGAVMASFFAVTWPANILGAARSAKRHNLHVERRRAEALLSEAWTPALELDAEDVVAP